MEIDVDNVAVVALAPDLDSRYGEAYLVLSIITRRNPIRLFAHAFPAMEELNYTVFFR